MCCGILQQVADVSDTNGFMLSNDHEVSQLSDCCFLTPQFHKFVSVLLLHQSLVGVVPTYLADDCCLLSDASCRPLQSNSNDMRKLLVPRTHNKFGDWSF